mmetsp:Transcript_80019/g.229667  ORF Transcript_80019/g.229667 Transcript_80019/m.229667 type:complete len:310 (-) Transcript_80019:277-1206(-)
MNSEVFLTARPIVALGLAARVPPTPSNAPLDLGEGIPCLEMVVVGDMPPPPTEEPPERLGPVDRWAPAAPPLAAAAAACSASAPLQLLPPPSRGRPSLLALSSGAARSSNHCGSAAAPSKRSSTEEYGAGGTPAEATAAHPPENGVSSNMTILGSGRGELSGAAAAATTGGIGRSALLAYMAWASCRARTIQSLNCTVVDSLEGAPADDDGTALPVRRTLPRGVVATEGRSPERLPAPRELSALSGDASTLDVGVALLCGVSAARHLAGRGGGEDRCSTSEALAMRRCGGSSPLPLAEHVRPTGAEVVA